MKALIALEDGTVFEGHSFTGPGEAVGEIVFNTSMSGYQEILTDPSYTGQIITMTYPLIGNYGVNPDDMESLAVHPKAFLVKEYNRLPSNFRATATLAEFLNEHGVLGVEGFDTRALVRHIRNSGAMKGIVSTEDTDRNSLVERARNWPGLIGQDMVKLVTCAEPYTWIDGRPCPGTRFEPDIARNQLKIVAFDFGIKFNQIRLFEEKGCRVQDHEPGDALGAAQGISGSDHAAPVMHDQRYVILKAGGPDEGVDVVDSVAETEAVLRGAGSCGEPAADVVRRDAAVRGRKPLDQCTEVKGPGGVPVQHHQRFAPALVHIMHGKAVYLCKARSEGVEVAEAG